MLVVVVLAIQRPKCIYGVVDVCVLRIRGAMEIKFSVRDENGPPSGGVPFSQHGHNKMKSQNRQGRDGEYEILSKRAKDSILSPNTKQQ